MSPDTPAPIMSARHSSPPPPTSAAVLEFICLFTHDLKRKQKRWQDGRLKYHTFNGRIMVHDDRGNFVGDMHWRHDWDLDEGEEVQLERGGVLIQVQELSSRYEQDLSELLDKRAKEKEKRQMQAVARTPAPSAVPRPPIRPVVTRPVTPTPLQQQHRPLHQIIGTPSGHHGRALVPKDSPFEQRQQAAESPDDRAAKRRKHNDPPPSKSGYASALFGQALTLSATPMSSLPAVSRRTVRQRDPTPEVEESVMQPVQEDPKPPLKEQPKASRHFNQSSGQPRPSETAKDAMPSPCEVEQDAQPSVRRKKDHDLSKKQPAARRKDPIPVNDDDEVIEIEDPDADSVAETRPPARSVTEAPKPPKPRTKDKAKPTGALAKKTSRLDASRAKRTEDTPNEEMDGDMSKKQEGLAKLKKPKTKTSKPIAKKTTTKAAATKNIEEPPLAAFTRDPSDPVIELRLKSRRKRGLMMMANMPKEPRDQHRGDRTPIGVSRNGEAKEVEETDYSFRSPSPQPRRRRGPEIETLPAKATASEQEDDTFGFPSPEPYTKKSRNMGRKDQTPPRHNDTFDDLNIRPGGVSDELGEDDNDPFRIFSPAPCEVETAAMDHAAGEPDDGMDFLGSILDDDLGAASLIHTGDAATKPVIAPISNASGMITKSPPQGKIYDPYRVPSSPPEEPPEPPARLSPVSRNAAAAHSGGSDEPKAADNNNKSKKAKRPRRNVVIDEDDEQEVSPEPTKEAGVVDVVDLDSDADLPVPKQSKKATKRKPKAPDFDEDEIGSDLNDVPLKRPEKLKKSRKAVKRKTTVQAEEPDIEPEDDQPVKRRRGTRKSRGRDTEPEETSLPSDQEQVEEGPSSKKSRKQKAPKTSANRPRLERLKKSVKSRELIGFNLAALNAPLGFRGFGMPFSILSSPVNESLQRRIDNHAALEPSSESMLDDHNNLMPMATSDALQMIDEADEMAFGEPLSPVVQRGHMSIEQAEMGTRNRLRSSPSVEACNPFLPGPTALKRHSRPPEDTVSRQVEEKAQKSEQTSVLETASPKVLSAPPRTEFQPINEAEVTKPVEIARPQERQGLSKVGQSAADASTKKATEATSNAQREAPAAPNSPEPRNESTRDAPEASVDMAPISMSKGPVAKPFAPPSKANLPTLQEETITASIGHNEGTPDKAAIEVISEFTLKTAPVLPAFKKPEQIVPPALQRQDSGAVGKLLSDHRELVDVEPEGSTEIAPAAVVPALPPFKRPEQTPALRREPSHAATAGAQVEATDDDALETTNEPAPVAIPALPAFKRPEQKAVPALRQQLSSNGSSNMTNEPGIDGDDNESADKIGAGDQQQTVEQLAPKITRVPRRQPPSFKPPSKTKASAVQTENEVPTPNPCDVADFETAEDNPEGSEDTAAAPESAAPLQRPRYRTLQRTVSVTRRINNITAELPENAPAETSTSGETSTKAATSARITNPASRGRKAAVKSDAKGPVPQRLLPPTQPFALGPISTADFTMTPFEEPPKEPEKPRKKMKFPGFQSAKDEGPWSREAYDLLENGRPG